MPLGGSLESCQYAYRRERGTEHHLLDLTDFARDMRSENKRSGPESVDVHGAFDAVSHKNIRKHLKGLVGIITFISTWQNGYPAEAPGCA